MITLEKAAQLLLDNDNFDILTHRFPDGDTLGSAFALCSALRSIGKSARVVTEKEIPAKFMYLANAASQQDFTAEYVVSVDVAKNDLLGLLGQKYDHIDLCIDHHASNSMKAENVYVDSESAANCEIIYKLILQLGATLTHEMANALYTGISTDTGCFMYSNTTAQTHKIAAELIGIGCDWFKINKEMFDTKTHSRIALERSIYDGLEFFCDGKCAVACTSLETERALGLKDEDFDGVSSIPRRIEGVLIGITVRERPDGTCKVSVRTNENINASTFCGFFGGGGHAAASGCTIADTLPNAKQALVELAEKTLAQEEGKAV